MKAGQQVPAADQQRRATDTEMITGTGRLLGWDEAWSRVAAGLWMAANLEASGCA
jgi:hypothetical protein